MFSGKYVKDVKLISQAALLAKLNALFISPAGWGKTAIMSSMADYYAPAFFLELDPSTPPDAVKGPYNPAKVLNGEMERITKNTPFDPDCNVVFLDEVGRASEPMFDALLPVLAGRNTRCPVVASTNFMPTDSRQAAFVDRFALWAWIIPTGVNSKEVALSNMQGHNPQLDMSDMPTLKEVKEIQAAAVGPMAQSAVVKLIADLENEVLRSGRSLNPRRISQWARLLAKHGMWVTGSNDFSAVPDQTARLLRYANSMPNQEEWVAWGELASSVYDVVGSAIEAVLADVYDKMMALPAYDPVNPAGMQKFFTVIANGNSSLAQVADANDPRVQEATTKINGWFADLSQGKQIQR